jgi:hypothetical protein
MSHGNQCNVKMEDQRFFTDYRPNDQMNVPLGTHMNSHQYRAYLQKNASKMMKEVRDKLHHQRCDENYKLTIPTKPLYPKSFV